MTANELKILYVEDDASIRTEMTEILEFDFPHVFIAENGLQALQIYQEVAIDIIISDVQMPHMDGLELAGKVIALNPQAQIILTTAFNDTNFIKKAQSIGVKYCINKPVVLAELDQVIEKCMAVL